jgi:hypothetical protein
MNVPKIDAISVRPFEPPPPLDDGRETAPARDSKKRPRFELIPFDQIRPETGAAYLVKGLLPRAGVAVFWGPPKCGKSFLVLDLLMHVALGWNYRDRRVKPGAVVYCALEGAEGFRRRVEAFRQSKLAGDANPPFFLMATPLKLIADREAFISEVRGQLRGVVPVAICIDTLNRSLVGSESSDEDMSAYVGAADAIRDAFDCLVVIIHHCGHNGERPRGHSSLMGALDVQISVKRDEAKNVVAELELAKDGPVGDIIVSRLDQVEIGIDDDGDAVTSCIVEPTEGTAGGSKSAGTRHLTKASQIALHALAKAVAEVGVSHVVSNHVPDGVLVVTVDQWRAYAYQSGISDTDTVDAKRVAFKRAHDALVAGKHVSAWADHRWAAT